MRGSPAGSWRFLFLSVVPTVVIWAVVTFPEWVAAAYLGGEDGKSALTMLMQPFAFFGNIFELMVDKQQDGTDYNLAGYFTGKTLISNLGTALVPAVWLIFALILAPLSRALLWDRRRGANWLGRLLSVERRPFTALGAVSAVLIVACGVLAWAAAFPLLG